MSGRFQFYQFPACHLLYLYELICDHLSPRTASTTPRGPSVTAADRASTETQDEEVLEIASLVHAGAHPASKLGCSKAFRLSTFFSSFL